ncbi:MAG TPA: SMP-30/gluconolactonase/LRE family protein [Puia sp.]|uniref:SMP-30/gluconolactonase/LRE family protein n=1 Tax=Puia sp. TaxID=2045100 RepID=UPI002D0D4641|nr:SMP-30/gluconolactonase/LRE family protein [Puia sp.]HVU94427.1 SMP-30/gluconolactonase/LRE family protein [Puia sp.]
MFHRFYPVLLALLAPALVPNAYGQELRELAPDKPQAIADLRNIVGAAYLNAQWYVQWADFVKTGFRLPGPSPSDPLPLYPTSLPVKTASLRPQIGTGGFDAGFKPIPPDQLERRQGAGLVSAVWYKVELTIPNHIGAWDPTGSTAVFEIVVDDYSEIWVNGKQAHGFGQVGNGLISGYNAANRVVLTDHARPGDKFTIAILGINGPLGMIPDNYIWIRNAVVDFYSGLPEDPVWKDIGHVYRIAGTLDSILPPNTKIDKVAGGFRFTEGPVWHPDGYLLFSDPNTNVIYRYNPANHDVTIYMSHSGYTGADIGEYGQPGSNGLAIDREGRLIADQHGNRRVVRFEKKGPTTVLTGKFEGKRLNSPNDLVLRSDGTLYFTDPPYGLPHFFQDPRKELDFSGVYMVRNGKTQLVAKDLGGPNGIAFSPDEKWLYVTNWDIRDIHHTKTIWRYAVNDDGTLHDGAIFFDCNQTEDEEALDGMKVDREGNLFVSAPGGVWIISPGGQLLGKIVTPERPANMAWGDTDGKTLYLTAHSSLYKLRVATGGKFSWQ